MQKSTDRILTTHVGRLDGPPDFRARTAPMRGVGMATPGGRDVDLPGAIAWVVQQQVAARVDIVSDGELGKIGYSLSYYGRRLSGLESRRVTPGEAGWMSLRTGERLEFAEFYRELNWPSPPERVICTGAVSYIGQHEVIADIERFAAALDANGVPRDRAFMCVLAPGWLEHFFHNEHYATDEAYLFALADAMKHEYAAIVDAGFTLQIDDPALPDTWDMIVPPPPVEEYRRFARLRVDALNHAIEGLPADRIRYHICWGSWHGPHTHDLPLEHVIDLMLAVKAGAYSLEAANPRHEHEWKLWRDRRLPEGKVIIPGVISHATNVVEHPELVADRIERWAHLVGRENVIAGTDCGLGFRVHPQIAWAKLRALADGAAIASKRLWSGCT
jgi:5-methyltetrahydropteroyltriglutamate--homocysteine methyltransferase